MQCPACGYDAATVDFGSPAKCPECGAYYEKALIARAKRNELAGISDEAINGLADHGKLTARLKMLAVSWKVWAAVLFLVFVSWSAVVVKARQDERAAIYAAVQAEAPRKPAPISNSAYTNYTRDVYQKTFAIWGESGVKMIMDLERLAAEHVAQSINCDLVDTVMLSEFRSYPPREPVVFVDCQNGNRFFVGKRELGLSSDALTFKKVY